MFEPLHVLPEAVSSHIPVNSIGGDWAPHPVMSQWRCLFPLQGHTAAAVRLEHETPLLETWEGHKTLFFVFFFFFFSLSETFQGHVCVHWVYKAHFHSISLWLRSFNRIIIVPSFIKCDRLVSASFLEPCCPEISAYRPLEHKTDWADVSDTLRDASPADSVCRIWCERLNWDSLLLLLLLLESPKK